MNAPLQQTSRLQVRAGIRHLSNKHPLKTNIMEYDSDIESDFDTGN